MLGITTWKVNSLNFYLAFLWSPNQKFSQIKNQDSGFLNNVLNIQNLVYASSIILIAKKSFQSFEKIHWGI